MRRSRGTAKLPREFKVIVPIPYLVKYTFLNNYVSYFEICACPYIKYLQDQLKIKTVVISNDNSTPWTKNKRKIQWLQFLLSVVIFYCSSIFFSLSLKGCLLYTSPSPRDKRQSRMPSSA